MFLVKELGGKIKRDGILVIGDRGSESFIYPISGKGQPMLSDELVFIRDRFANLLEWSVNTDLTKSIPHVLGSWEIMDVLEEVYIKVAKVKIRYLDWFRTNWHTKEKVGAEDKRFLQGCARCISR
ncbi:hypothetical protein CRG98_018218 [Punica granatum]|uniref:Uncharacterized protein n=1 Tax=Punica granatum TaxID=22663 RepID=A0A2I0JZT5_PUNGR|nr:hypothetical protein CRG98_018218 [Punica granatum]